jgi:hypothetical protein
MSLCKGFAVALVACGITVSAAQGKPLTREETLDVSAVVESVDQAARTVVLVGDGGQRAAFVAGPEIKNLADVKAGDRVRLTYKTVKIDAVDPSFNTVTFTRADGITRVVGVDDPEAQRFVRTLKPGDSVEISYSEAVAVGVERVAGH